ncbi:MAG: GyrI-like domain-containing protein [Hyphomicrobium sp.]
MKANLVYLRPLRVAYVRSVGPYAQSSAEAWARMFDWLNDNSLHSLPGCGYGLLLDNHLVTDPDKCRYDACVEVSSVPENRAEGSLQVRNLPGGAYVRDRYRGCYLQMREKILSVRQDWSNDSDLVLDDRRPIVHIFMDDPRRGNADQLRSDFCIPVIASLTGEPSNDHGTAN